MRTIEIKKGISLLFIFCLLFGGVNAQTDSRKNILKESREILSSDSEQLYERNLPEIDYSYVNSGSHIEFTLEECIQYAIDHNIDIKRLKLERENADVQLNTSQMSRLPDLNGKVGQTWGFGRTQTSSGLYENNSQSNTSFSLGTSVPIFTGFRIPNEIARDKLELSAATEGLEKAKEDLSLSITSLFLQVLFNQELLKINEEQLALTQIQVERTSILVDAGKVPPSQLYDIEAQVAKDEVSVIEAKNAFDLAILDLKQSLELEQSVNFDISAPEFGNVINQFSRSIQPPGIIYNNAVNVKPVIKQQEYKVESSKKSLKIAQSGYMPTLDLSLGISTNYFYLYKDEVEDPKTGIMIPYSNTSFSEQFKNNRGEAISLNLAIPIFNRFQVRNSVRSARLNISNQQLILENTKKTLYKEIQTAYTNAAASQEKYTASVRAVKATSESFRYAQERYEIGKSAVFEFNEAKTKLVQSQSEEVQAKYDYILRAKILDFYNGIPITL